jgi:hypothetical protein
MRPELTLNTYPKILECIRLDQVRAPDALGLLKQSDQLGQRPRVIGQDAGHDPGCCRWTSSAQRDNICFVEFGRPTSGQISLTTLLLPWLWLVYRTVGRWAADDD